MYKATVLSGKKFTNILKIKEKQRNIKIIVDKQKEKY